MKRRRRVQVVEYISPERAGAACPVCGRRPVKVTGTGAVVAGGRIRYHACGCGWRGKSVEGLKHGDTGSTGK